MQQQNPPLDQVLKPRNIKRNQKQQINLQQQKQIQQQQQQDNIINEKLFQLQKNKPISKDKKQPPKYNSSINQMNSNDIAQRLISNYHYTHNEIRQFLIRAGEIRSLKYDKFTDKIKNNLEEYCCFSDSLLIFQKIMYNYDDKICSTFMIQSIYRGFQSFWINCHLEDNNDINQLLNYYEKIPNCINKIYLAFLIKLSKKQQTNNDTYKSLRKTVYRMVLKKMKCNEGNQQQNQKIVGLVFSFNLEKHVDIKQMMNMIPVKKINQYIDEKVKKQYQQNEKKVNEIQCQNINNIKQKQVISNFSHINSLIFSQIHHSIQQNNDKQALRLIKLHKLPIQHFPIFLDKLQYKYLYHVDRQPIYVIDFLISKKPSLIIKMIEIYRKKRKFRQVDHFVNRFYMQLGNKLCMNPQKILENPLIKNDKFGPTEEYVLKENGERYFHLNQIGIQRENVYVINSETILNKCEKDALIELLNSKQIGLDSQTRSGIHVLDKTVLEIIQIYCPRMKRVFLFDVQDLKKNKNKKEQNRNINLIDQQNNKPCKNKQQNKISQTKPQKSWTQMCKIIKIILKRCTIYGHALHSDLIQIIQCLSLDIKQNQLKIKDSQVEFKKQFPKQTKSNLLYLSEFCFNKKISKYQQCSAWNYRPLRQAQIHYAAMDAVIPYKLVNWIEGNKLNKSLIVIS